MVSISKPRSSQNRLRTRSAARHYDKIALLMLLTGVFFVLAIGALLTMTIVKSSTTSSDEAFLRHPHVHVQQEDQLNEEHFNALAFDILNTLDCVQFFNETTVALKEQEKQKKEEQELMNKDGSQEDPMMTDDKSFVGDGGMMDSAPKTMLDEVTARALFCVAAMDNHSSKQAVSYWKDKIHCNASMKERALLELWSSARSAFHSKSFLVDVVSTLAKETERTILEKKLYMWLPPKDEGFDYSMNTINDPELNADHGGVHGLSLGPSKTFVDVGSALGPASFAVSLLYPGTKIVSIEAAAPNWFMQELSWICVDPDVGINVNDVTRLLAGVGSVDGGMQFAPMLWRREIPSGTRSWTPSVDRMPEDVELDIPLKPWHSILAEAGVTSIDVLNVDCEGCEYNLVPALSDDEFRSISTVTGEVHWGYIPQSKLPSSKRADITHKRLCTHENMARTAKECCAFPDLPVISSVQGEVLKRGQGEESNEPSIADTATVSDVAGEFCNDFASWSIEKHLGTVESDWGWFQLTSTADEEI